MSECDRYLEMISQLVDGELPEPQKTELLAHLDGCANCRRVYDAFSAISLSLGETAAPEGFAEGVMAAVRTQGGHGSRRAKKPGKSQVRYMALAACIVLAVLATVRLALPSGKSGAASGETSQRENSAAEDSSGGAANGVLEQAGKDETPAVEQFGTSGGSAVQLDAEQITSIEISSPDGDTTLTDGEDISLVAALLSPSGQAPDWKELGKASYSVDINYAGGSETLEVYVSGGSLVCATDGGGAYSAAGSPAEFLDALN